MARFHWPCVASYLPIQKPRVSVTSTWSSPGRRSGSPGGLPIVNLPSGHQHSLTPATSRSSPAFDPVKAVGFGSSAWTLTGAGRWQPSRARRMNTFDVRTSFMAGPPAVDLVLFYSMELVSPSPDSRPFPQRSAGSWVHAQVAHRAAGHHLLDPVTVEDRLEVRFAEGV